MSRAALSERALVTLLAGASAAGPVAVAIYVPVLPLVRAEFGVSVEAAGLTVSVPLAVFALGLLVWGPLSDRHGRRPVLLVGLGINVLGSCLAFLAPSIGLLTAGRLVQALGAAAGVTVARATIGDLFGRERMARMIAHLTMVMLLANSIAPAIGGALGDAAGWRTVFAVLALASLVVWLAALRYLPETRPAAARHGFRQLITAAHGLLTLPAFGVLALVSGAIYAEFFVFVSLMPYVLAKTEGLSGGSYGLWTLCIAGGYFAGNWFVSRFAHVLGVGRLLGVGLAISLLGAISAWALAAAGLWRPLAVFTPWLAVAFGQGLGLPTLTALAVGLAPRSTGSAAGLLGFVQQIVGALAVQAMALSPIVTPLPVATFTALTALAAGLGFWWAWPAIRATADPRPG